MKLFQITNSPIPTSAVGTERFANCYNQSRFASMETYCDGGKRICFVRNVEQNLMESFEISGQFFRDDVSYSDIAQYRVIPRAWYLQF